MKSAVMCPFPMTEEEFWRQVRNKLTEGNHPLLAAVEAVRDEHDIHQNHISILQTRIGFTCFYLHGVLPPRLKTLDELRGMIDEHIRTRTPG